jgi:hypothetical protein
MAANNTWRDNAARSGVSNVFTIARNIDERVFLATGDNSQGTLTTSVCQFDTKVPIS